MKMQPVLRPFRRIATPFLRWALQQNYIAKVYWNLRTDELIRNYRTGAVARNSYPIYRAYIKEFMPERLLDIGCGSGRLFPLFSELNIPEVIGIDISPYAIKKIQPYPNCRAYVMKVSDLNFPPDYFDAAISNAVLRYMSHGASINCAISNITEQCKSVLIREPVRGRESYYNYLHDYKTLFQGKMHLLEHTKDGIVDVMIFSK